MIRPDRTTAPQLALALNAFVPRKQFEAVVDEEIDAVLEYDDRLTAELMTVDSDIAENDDLRLSHLW